MIVHIIRYLYFFLVIGTPFIVYSSTSELFEFNKMMLIYFTTVGIVGLWALDQVNKGKFSFKMSLWYIPFLAFLAGQILSTAFSMDIHTSIFGYYGRFNGGLLSILTYLSLAFILIQIADKPYVIKLMQVIFWTAVSVVLWGLPGRYGADLSCLVFTGRLTNACWTDQFKPAERMFSTLGQPNWLGAYLAAVFFIGLFLILRRSVQEKWPLLFYSAGTFILFLGILFTRSRSALAATAICLVIFIIGFVLTQRKRAATNIKLLVGLGFAIVAAVVIFRTGISAVDRYLRFPATTTAKNSVQTAPSSAPSAPGAINVTDSFDIRKVVWVGAIELGKRYPLFGTGVETFAYSYYFTRPISHNETSEWDFLYNKAHNEFLNYFATTGYIGVGLYILMIISILILLGQRLYKHGAKNSEESLVALALCASFVSIQITNFFGFSITSVQLIFYFTPALALVVSHTKWAHVTIDLPSTELFRKTSQFACILMMVLGIIYYSRYVLADITYASADVYQRSGEYQQAFTLYQTALSLRYEHVYEDKFSGTLANLAFLSSYDSDKTLMNDLIKLSKTFNEKSLQASPKNVLYWKTKSKNAYLFYQSTMDKDYLTMAFQSMETAQKLAPTDPKLPYTLALFYSLAADEEKNVTTKESLHKQALVSVKKSIQLKPDYEEAQVLLKELIKKEKDAKQNTST